MIHISKIHILAETLKEFSIAFIEESGKRVHLSRVALTSFHSSGRTMNIICLDSREIRTIIRVTIIEFNGEEVVL